MKRTHSAAIGRISCLLTFLLGIGYLVVTAGGFLSLSSPDEPIGDPYFTLMELLTILIAPLMAINMLAIYFSAPERYKLQGLAAFSMMIIMAGITSGVHFVVLTLNHQLDDQMMTDLSLFFSFKWPSVVYILDILAWDWFFALSMLFAAPVFQNDPKEKLIRSLMLISGVLSLIGLAGVPLGDMQFRNIGIIGYAVVAPFVFLLVGINFARTLKDEVIPE